MIKRIIVVALLLAIFAGAQGNNWSNYGSDQAAASSDDRVSTQPAQPSPEPTLPNTRWSISIHPVSLLVFTTIFGVPWVTFTVENNLSSRFSLSSRPELMWASFADGDIFAYGLYEGVRFYFNEGHKGFYVSPQIGYESVSVDYDSDYYNHRSSSSGEASAFIFACYLGLKIQSGHVVMFSELGFGYTMMSSNDIDDGDADKVAESGFGIDLNYAIGYAF